MRTKRMWRHFRYWLVGKLIPEEERKVLFNIRMGFYGYKEGGAEWKWE